MDNHRSKTANIREFYLPHNTLLGLNKLKYFLPIVNVFVHVRTSTSSEPTKTVQRFPSLKTVLSFLAAW
jgi:hypothetical protein